MMKEQETAERDRLKAENAYLISRVIEVETELKTVLSELRETFSGLHALERIKLLKTEELAESFQVSTNRIYELVRTKGLPVLSLGEHQMRFDPLAVRRWLDAGGLAVVREGKEEGKNKSAAPGLNLVRG